MTSDRGTSGEPELRVKTPPVSTKGLNPNANEFHCKADPTPSWQPPDIGEALTNGDSGKSSPPTPCTDSDYSTLNGNQDSQSIASADSESGSGVDNQDSSELVELKSMLLHQLEYYFSRENLNHDSYLVSQMDSDQFVPISTVANFNQVKKLTTDLGLIVDVLRGSQNVQVDGKGEKVRPLIKRCIVILREIPDGTTMDEIHVLFSGANSPKFSSCEFAHNNSWYITFESDEDAQQAYRYLREEVKTFKGVPIMARIKAKPLVQTNYTPKNGVMKPLSPYETSQQAQVQPSQQQPTAPTQQPQHTHAPTFPQNIQRFSYPQHVGVNNMPFVAQQSFAPLYQHTHQTMIPTAWATSPPPFYDPGLALAMNGFQAQAYHKLANSAGRQGFQAMRNRNPPKMHNRAQSNPERSPTEVLTPRQHMLVNSAPTPSRPSPRVENATSIDNPSQALFKGSDETAQLARQSDAALRDQIKRPVTYNRQRRREKEEGAKNSRSSSSQPPAKDAKPIEEKFELEQNSFPPLPGSTNSTTTGEVFESKMSDVVRGTAKAVTKPPPIETKPAPTTTTTTTTATQVPPKSKDSTPSPSEQRAHRSMPNSPPQSPIKPSKPTSTSSIETSNKAEAPPKEQQKEQPKQQPVQQSTPKQPAEPKSPEPGSQKPLSYAQMAQRARAAKEDKSKEDAENNNKDKDSDSDSKPTLKEQTTKGQSAKANGPPPRDSRSEPKDQRPAGPGGRRNKENRDRRDRRKEMPPRAERPSSAK